MRTLILGLALVLAPSSSWALEHFVFGLADTTAVTATNPGGTLASGETTPSGSWRFTTDEGGPFQVSTLTIAPCPNLVVTSIETGPAAPACGDSVRVRALVRNIGQAGTTVLTRTDIKFDGALKLAHPTPLLAPGAEAWTSWVWLGVVPVGVHQLTACADAGALVREESESDNCR